MLSFGLLKMNARVLLLTVQAVAAVAIFIIILINVISSTILLAVAIVLTVVLAASFILYKAEREQEGTTSSLHLQMVTVSSTNVPATSGSVELLVDLFPKQEMVPMKIYTNLRPDEVCYIKRYCRERHQIGKGSFAKVYRVKFQGEDLAIKEIEHKSTDIKIWVENEVELLQEKNHKNINKLFAWYIETDISYLAYKYIDGCNLADYLRGNCEGFTYSWKQSFRMIMGIAKGIQFLHQNKIIHVDIKPENIMVDAKDNEAKLIDFGFSRHVSWEGTHRSTIKVIGTLGYWAPEYCQQRKISYKHDVYSFGIVVLEMITGEKHIDQARRATQCHIPIYVKQMIGESRFEEAVDTKLKQNGWDIIAINEAFAVANIALKCVDDDKAARPDMDLVVTELSYMMSAHNDITLALDEERGMRDHNV